MKRLDYYRKNNRDLYESVSYKTGFEDLKATEAIQLKCISCAGTYRDAFKCKNEYCPLYIIKHYKMKRPHTTSEMFNSIRKNITETDYWNERTKKTTDL